MRKKYHYKITVESIDPLENGQSPEQPLSFAVSNHDDVLAVNRRLYKKLPFDAVTTASFTLGLKLLTEVMLEHRNDPLFAELKPAIVSFMKELKTQIRNAKTIEKTELPLDVQQPKVTAAPEEKAGLDVSSSAAVSQDATDEFLKQFNFVDSTKVEFDTTKADDFDFKASDFDSESFDLEDFDSIEVQVSEGVPLGNLLSEKLKGASAAKKNEFEEIDLEDFGADGMVSTGTLDDDGYTLVEKVSEDGTLEGIELLDLDEEPKPRTIKR